MKKLVVLLSLLLVLCGCRKENKEDIIKEVKSNITNAKSYKIVGNMEISNDEETFTYSLESYYLKNDYYKVILVNQTNNHEQVILRNKEDVYVITPALNKSFKFQSEWPNNSSQAYLFGSLVNDIENDKNVELNESDKGYIIKTKVNYPNNEELKYQKLYINDKKVIEKVEVFDENDIVKIKVNFEEVSLKANLKESDFNLKDYIKEENTEETCEEGNLNCQEENNNESEDATSIENIIYPLYIPSNTFLKSSETIETSTGSRVILTFNGEKNFVLIEEATIKSKEMEIVPVYGEPLMLSETIGALSANSLSFDVGNISYYLASTELTVNEMKNIANSLGNTRLVINTK